MRSKTSIFLPILFAAFFLQAGEAGAQAAIQAYAGLRNAQGATVGQALLHEGKDGVLITVRVEKMPPGLHAIHLHAVGKCEGPQFTTAGGHFNPNNKKHGLKGPGGHHAGDLPNLWITETGAGRFETVTNAVTLGAGSHSLFDTDGSAIVIHASEDDYKTDPAGNAGDRIACGAVMRGQPPK